jgi:hypothetical protein
MKKLLLLLLFLINIITNNAIAHQGTDELTFENWIKIIPRIYYKFKISFNKQFHENITYLLNRIDIDERS